MWNHTDAVTAWIALVEESSKEDDFVEGDEAALPSYPTREYESLQDEQSANLTTQSSRYKRPRVDWTVAPSECLQMRTGWNMINT